jgi:hypothetical protein
VQLAQRGLGRGVALLDAAAGQYGVVPSALVALYHQHLVAVDDHGGRPGLGRPARRLASTEPDPAQEPP